ncbi:MAG: oligosaccharide flippase family protein [Spirochaetes bacterium]|nr:oligosaccharide flippase family protein [Spirochaetota bacterium]
MSIKKLFKQSSSYFIGEVLICFSAFISFPILSRLLTKDQYGLMSLISATIAVLGKIASLGSKYTIVRFYHHYKKNLQSRKFIFSLVGSIFGTGILILCSAAIIFLLFINKTDAVVDFSSLFFIAFIAGIFQNSFNLLNMYYRLEENILFYNIFGISRKYIGMCVALLMVYSFRSLYFFYLGNLLVEVFLLFVICYLIWKSTLGLNAKLSFKKVMRETVKYGFPLAISSIATIIFSLGDRYVIAYLLDTTQVAVYSVGANLCHYFKDVIITAINLALLPIIFKYWEENKINEAKQTLTDLVQYYGLCVMFLVGLLCLVPNELIVLVASRKYIDVAVIIPILISGTMIGGLMVPFTVAFNVKRKTQPILVLTVVAAGMNILLNFVFIPYWGIKGAAYATVLTSMTLVTSTYFLSRRYLLFKTPFFEISKYLLAAVLGFLVCNKLTGLFNIEHIALRLFQKTIIYIIIYTSAVFILDAKIRRVILEKMVKIIGNNRSG